MDSQLDKISDQADSDEEKDILFYKMVSNVPKPDKFSYTQHREDYKGMNSISQYLPSKSTSQYQDTDNIKTRENAHTVIG